jgi:phosphoglycolate phosphatase-like HAD superfamily hydrolase
MSALKRIYMDLDGPLLDVSRRYYTTHLEVCRFLGIISALSKADYWEMKRSRTPVRDILSCTDASVETAYRERWLSMVESDEALRLDEVFGFVPGVLSELGRTFDLWLVSLRRRKDAGRDQVERLGLARHFGEVLFVGEDGVPPAEAKKGAIAAAGHCAESLFVGDTEVDVGAARLLGIPSVGVLSGIRNRHALAEFRPDWIIDDIRALSGKVGL